MNKKRFTVVSSSSVEDQIAQMRLDNPDRWAEIHEALIKVEAGLAMHPERLADEVREETRVWIEGPLHVEFCSFRA